MSRAGVLALAALLLAGCATRPPGRVDLASFPSAQQARAAGNLGVFNRAWDLVHRKHYDPRLGGLDWPALGAEFAPRAAAADDESALYAVLNDLLGRLQDSHTRALSPDAARERTSRERARTGLSLQRIGNRWVVAEVLPGSPAAEAGIRAGWIVAARDGSPLGERPEFSVREGAVVRWELLDAEDRPVSVAVVARRLPVAPPPAERVLDGGFVLLRFDGFDAANRRWLSRRLKAQAGAPGVVVDLRRNAGGDTFSLGTVVGEFFGASVACGTFVARDGARDAQTSWQLGSAAYRGRVAVLVDAGTASAAEILAAVLQEHGRARVFGRQTAGAVLASRFHGLPDGGELQLSREDYLTPRGRRLEGAGVVPDLTVPRTLAEVRAGRDQDLEAALAWLRAGP